MNIAPVSCFNSTSFNGITKFIRHDDDCSDSYEAFFHSDFYEYYPFLDESDDSIDEVKKNLDFKHCESRDYPYYSIFTTSSVNIHNRLPITQKQYEYLSRKFSDSTIINRLSGDAVLDLFV